MSRLIALDTETTGLDPRLEDVFEIAAVDLDTGDEHVWTIEPSPTVIEAMHPKAAEVNHYHERTAAPDWIWDAPRDGTREDVLGVLNGVRHVLDGAHVVGAVPDFDIRHLAAMFERRGVDPPRTHYHLIDVEVMAVGWIACRRQAQAARGHDATVAAIDDVLTLPYKSDDLAEFCGIEPPSDDERHTALGDARWVARWYRKLTGEVSA